jgi:hypothetical protein
LRRLPVDADEGPPHVFRVAKTNGLRNAFDRFARRLNSTASQIRTESFDHAGGRCPGLCSEYTAELPEAHARRLRQTVNRERFGNVIAGITKRRGEPIAPWSQIDGSCELRLAAMATMVDDKMLRYSFGNRKTVVLLDQRQSKIDAGCDTG